ncbi:MAG: polyprenyl synthetase family protein [Bacteroidales bacterium]
MSAESLYRSYQDQIEKALSDIQLCDQPEDLYQPIRYVLEMGGKRLRPMLCLLSNDLYEGDTEAAMHAALALEVFHNFTLLHDDIMDKAYTRRKQDCVHIKWNPNVAILSGDAMQILAFELLSNVPKDKLKVCLDLFAKTAREVCEGQQYDMEFETRSDVTEAEYVRMIRLKTAVLLAASLKMGAILAGANKKEANHLYQYGIHLGLAFQLQDDWLDAFGSIESFGKRIGGDIVSNKKTYLLIHALENAKDKDAADLTYWISVQPEDPTEKIQAVKAIFERTGVDALCRNEIRNNMELAMDHLHALQLPTERIKPLMDLGNRLMERNH